LELEESHHVAWVLAASGLRSICWAQCQRYLLDSEAPGLVPSPLLLEILPLESRQNLLLLSLLVRFILGLLPGLLQRGELAHGGDLVATGLELVLRKPLTLEQWGVNCLEKQVILRSCKVQKTQSVYMSLILWWQRDLVMSAVALSKRSHKVKVAYPMHRRLDITASQETERIARIDSQATVQRLCPLPVSSLVVTDLQGSDRLTEE
jgi:hypothetical protein